MRIPDDLTCLLRNLYAGQEATVRTRYGTMDWFKIGEGIVKDVYCHPAYLTSMQSIGNAGLDDSQAGIRLPRKTAITSDDDTTLMAENKEELKGLLMKVKRGQWKKLT